MYYPFDSRNPLYKSKFGAVASGESLKLRLLLHRDANVHEAFLCLKADGETAKHIKMEPAEWLDGYRFYEITVNLTEGLYFYCFSYTSDFGDFNVTAFEHNVGHVSSEGKWWQITCYDKDFTTPNWIKGGIIYQIFPDRFKNSGKKKKDVPKDRYIREHTSALRLSPRRLASSQCTSRVLSRSRRYLIIWMWFVRLKQIIIVT